MADAAERREAAIERYGLLVEEPGRDLRALVALAAQVCDVSSAAINLITSDAQHQIATVGFEAAVCAREDSMCAAVLEEADPVVVADATDDPRFRANPFVTGEIGAVRFYASAPLRTQHGVVFGRLCVFDEQPRHLDPDQVEALWLLAGRIVDVLELRLRTRELEASLADLRQARDELYRSNRRLSLFAAQVSHDLRTPLTAILLNAEMLMQEPAVADDPVVSKHVAAAVDAGRRMNLLIDEFLESAQVGATVRMLPVDLRGVADAVVQDVQPLVDDAELIVDPLPTVIGDEQQLYAVLLNLVTNALKHRQPGHPARVRVTAEQLEGRWRIEVSDNGVGIPSELIGEMFQPFVRGSSPAPGSGIGLASAKRVVEAHGGQIGLKPGPDGVGTTAWFDVPD